MFDRSSNRFSFQGKSPTPPKICASTYYLPELFEPTLENYAPFLTLGPARPGLVSKYRMELPSPNTYCPTYRSHRIKGGTSMWNANRRFKYIYSVSSGPGDYDVPLRDEDMKILKPRKGKIHLGRVPYDLRGTGPSVPSKNDKNGYTVTPYDTVIKIPPDDNDNTLGPAFYKPKHVNFNTLRYRGNHFGMMKGQRVKFDGHKGPGPGSYELGEKPVTCFQVYLDFLRLCKRRTSRQPRFAEIVELNTRREDLPGPGEYKSPVSVFNIPAVKKKIHEQGFLSSDQRFKTQRAWSTPSPCEYGDNVSALENLQKPGSVWKTGFLSLCPRFPKKKLDEIPGPASYSVKGISEELQRKLPSRYIRSLSAFNSSRERVIDFVSDDLKRTPGSDYYFIKDREFPTKPRNAVFKSTVPRRTSPETGPAHYNTRMDDLGAKGCFFSTSRRKMVEGNDIPGPGSYKFHVTYADTVLKGTFNSTLGNPMLRKESNPSRRKKEN